MLSVLFAVGTIWFWLAIGGCLLCIGSSVANESNLWATVELFASIASLVLFTNVVSIILPWILANPILLITLFVGYYIVGTAFASYKWIRFIYSRKREYTAYKLKFIADNGLTAGTNPVGMRGFIVQDSPKLSNAKGRFIGWMTYWPLVSISLFLDDILYGFFIGIYNYVAGYLQRVTDRIWNS